MSRLVRIVLLAVIAPASLVVVGASPATADSGSWNDARDRDLSLDIRKVRLANRQHRVNVTVTLEDLTPSNAERGGSTVWFDVNPRQRGPEFAAGGGLGAETDWALSRVEGWRTVEIVPDCDIDLTTSFDTDTIRWTMGRGCFDGRRGMRIGAEVSRYNVDYTRLRTDYSPGERRLHGWIGRG